MSTGGPEEKGAEPKYKGRPEGSEGTDLHLPDFVPHLTFSARLGEFSPGEGEVMVAEGPRPALGVPKAARSFSVKRHSARAAPLFTGRPTGPSGTG